MTLLARQGDPRGALQGEGGTVAMSAIAAPILLRPS